MTILPMALRYMTRDPPTVIRLLACRLQVVAHPAEVVIDGGITKFLPTSAFSLVDVTIKISPVLGGADFAFT